MEGQHGNCTSEELGSIPENTLFIVSWEGRAVVSKTRLEAGPSRQRGQDTQDVEDETATLPGDLFEDEGSAVPMCPGKRAIVGNFQEFQTGQ